ncbi:MAG TPA: hypothetical protein VIT92_03620 [Burkholderiaceae bacterium]
MNAMTAQYKSPPPLGKQLRLVALVTTAILAVPLVAMWFTNEVNWGPLDFVLAAVLLGGAGSLLVLVTRKAATQGRKFTYAAGVALAFALVWVEIAVGIFGSPIAGS